jgi:16S rRNA (guanine527-N7)-methyltransferase
MVRKGLRSQLAVRRIEISTEQAKKVDRYVELLLAHRDRAGLTSLRDPDQIRRRHFDESLALLGVLEPTGAFASPAIDIGSGAGLPGVPIKIARPDLRLTLLEATGKKAAFLEMLCTELALQDVTVLHARAEDAGRDPAHREHYALALARAVAPLRVLVELALPFVRAGGHLAAVKGSGAEREAREAQPALAECGGEVIGITPLAVNAPHPPKLVLVRKTAATPERYPRRPGIPSKRPL